MQKKSATIASRDTTTREPRAIPTMAPVERALSPLTVPVVGPSVAPGEPLAVGTDVTVVIVEVVGPGEYVGISDAGMPL